MDIVEPKTSNQLTRIELDEQNHILQGAIAAQVLDNIDFEQLWLMQPEERHLVKMWGKLIPTPRKQQSHGFDYEYTGSKNNALPIPDMLKPMLAWVKEHISKELNGILVNWYGPSDYIGPHHDSTKGLVAAAPIVTVSLGESRVFRLSRGKGKDLQKVDIEAQDGSVIVLPWNTNKAWKHGVPRRKSYYDRRISVTFRAFDE